MKKSVTVLCDFINGDMEEFIFEPITIDEDTYDDPDMPIEEAFYNQAFIIFTSDKRKYIAKNGIVYKTDKIVKFKIKLEDDNETK